MHVAECSLIGIYDTFADSFGWHNAQHMCVVCTEIMAQCVYGWSLNVCAVRFLILFCVNLKLWFGFSFLKKLSRCSHIHIRSAFLFTYIFYKLILLCIERRVWTHNSFFFFKLHIPHTENKIQISVCANAAADAVERKYHENAIGSLCIYVMASKLRFAHQVNCKGKIQMRRNGAMDTEKE